MNQSITLILFLFCAISGLILLVRTLKDSRMIFTDEETLPRKILINSLFTGLSGSLVFMAVILFMGLNDRSYIWKPQDIFIASLIVLSLGLIIFLGTLWGFFSVGKYRSFLHHELEKKMTKKEK